MDFRQGDPVMHWTYGFGQIVGVEERALSGSNATYYAVQVRDLTVWVPADGKVGTRLRPPTSESEFKRLLSVLSGAGEPLPEDRHERRIRLQEILKDGRAESLCRIVRDLTAYQKTRSLNDNDQIMLKQSRNALLGEWGFVRSIPFAEAEIELHRLLDPEVEV